MIICKERELIILAETKRDQFLGLYERLSSTLPPEAVKASIMALMGISEGRYHGYLSENKPILKSPARAALGALPAPAPRRFPKPINIEDSNALIVTDLHAPYYNRGLLAVALDVAAAWGINRAAFLGDTFNMDAISKHPKTGYEEQPDVDMQIGGMALGYASHKMDELIIMNGNHDERVTKSLNARYPLRMLIKGALSNRRPDCRILVTDRDWVYLGDDWQIGHLSSYSKYPGKKAAQIAMVKDRNVAVGHDHMQGFMATPDGRRLGISVGSMLWANRFWYKDMRLNDYPDWSNGFLIVRDGIPYLFNERGSSALNGGKPWAYWEAELGIEIRSTLERYAQDGESALDLEGFEDIDSTNNPFETVDEELGTYEL